MADPCLDSSPEIALSVTGSPGALHAEIVPSADAYNGAELRDDGLWTPGRPPVITGSLPVSPVNGDEIIYLAGATNKVAWHLRYYAAETTASKWYFIGGPALSARRKPAGTIAPGGANNWQDLGGTDVVGPSITIPLAGYYEYQFGASIDSAADGQAAQVGLSPIGSDPADDDTATNTNSRQASVAMLVPAFDYGSVAAGTVMRLMYRCSGSGGTASYRRRWITARPVKVG